MVKEENIDYVEIAGIKWMRCNLEANSETEKGLYYLWGGTIGYTNPYNCKMYETDHLLYQSVSQLKKMGIIDNNNNLTEENDAVSKTIGNGWRMPTIDEFQLMIDNTDYTWEENFNDTGVNGGKFTLKDGSDYLFFPSSINYLCGIQCPKEYYGDIWTSTYSPTFINYANIFHYAINSAFTDCIFIHQALTIRGVKTKSTTHRLNTCGLEKAQVD